ncbi:unnamed protein product [Brassica oleracea]
MKPRRQRKDRRTSSSLVDTDQQHSSLPLPIDHNDIYSSYPSSPSPSVVAYPSPGPWYLAVITSSSSLHLNLRVLMRCCLLRPIIT